METAAAILTQILFNTGTFAYNLKHGGGPVGEPSDIAEKIRPFYAAMLKMVSEEVRLRR